MFDEANTIWNKIWKALSIIIACIFLFLSFVNADFVDLDYKLFHTDVGFVWTLGFWIAAVCTLTVNMLFLQLLENVRKLTEK